MPSLLIPMPIRINQFLYPKLALCWLFLLFSISGICQDTNGQEDQKSIERRKMYLERLFSFLEVDDGVNDDPRAISPSPLDADWYSWQERTGELPPDFSQMPTYWMPPDPLVMTRNGQNTPIDNLGQWQEQRKLLKHEVQYWITGALPPAPDNLTAEVLHEEQKHGVIARTVKLSFGPNQKASLELELMIPEGKGPFPVFLTQHNHAEWGQVAVRRGYIACVYAGSDSHDDADAWAELYYPEYDFSLLMRRAWGAQRAVDYLYTLDEVNKASIGIAGHSRNGKQSLMAAAFDERITACIPSSAGTGGELSYRHTREEYTVETIKVLTGQTTAWFHPRLRFFVGNEYKLPVDQNTLMALVAPRHLMISTAFTEPYGNPWGAEQMYHTTRKVYRFLGAEDHLSLKMRIGGHSTLPFIIEDYLDFFDYAFQRSDREPPRHTLWNYSFTDWVSQSGENIDPASFPVISSSALLVDEQGKAISSITEWERKKTEILKTISWTMGEAPSRAKFHRPITFKTLKEEGNYLDQMIERPEETASMGRRIVPGIGEMGHGFLYYPKSGMGRGDKVPVLIYLHDYSYSSGFTSTWPHTSSFSIEEVVNSGFAVFTFDQIGMGSRVEEGTDFYRRHPRWSKMGKMVSDISDAITSLEQLDMINTDAICVAGFSLGGTLGLYAAALDTRITSVAAFGAFSPLRATYEHDALPGIYEYSHVHGLQPRLGFFAGYENRLPVDYDEIIASIAPREILLLAPRYDQDAGLNEIIKCVSSVKDVYALYDADKAINFKTPEYYNQFTKSQFEIFLDWLRARD
jgi:dienelactone hydrolase